MTVYELSGNNINFFKGLWQTLVFSCIVGISHRLSPNVDHGNNDNLEEEEEQVYVETNEGTNTISTIKSTSTRISNTTWLVLFGVCYGVVFLAFCVGSKEIPLSYFVVIIATTPIFADLFSRCILQTRITILKMVICFTLTLGVCMVTYEGFTELKADTDFKNITIVLAQNSSTSFELEKKENLAKNYSVSTGEEDVETETPRLSYYYPNIPLGIICAFVFATLGALANVIPVKCKDVSCCIMMLYAGIGSLVFSVAANFIPHFQMHIALGNYYSGIPTLAVEICLGFVTMIANGLLILANSLSMHIFITKVFNEE